VCSETRKDADALATVLSSRFACFVLSLRPCRVGSIIQAGAAKVLAVDGSSFIAEVARKNAAANGFATGAADGGPRVLVLQVLPAPAPAHLSPGAPTFVRVGRRTDGEV
jgi:hypothetical protein